MDNYSPLRAVHRHGVNALVDKVAVIDSSVYPVVSNAVRSPQICKNSNNNRVQHIVIFMEMA